MIAIVGMILIGPFGLYSWYAQTYTDSSSASLWRRMSTSPQALGKSSTLFKPLISLLPVPPTRSYLFVPISRPSLRQYGISVHEAPRHVGREW